MRIMFREIDPEKITIACKTCGAIFRSVGALEAHRRNIWTRISHAFNYSEIQVHKSIYYAGHEVSCIVCEARYNECTPTKESRSIAYLIEEGETND